ncbi:cysteine rich repeat-containing protein [Bradyrhizobium sp. Ai1a-2]|uniref:cysteine rich repeat-containing protein n=1 Tax=Bradyrhizobium sp. Ai1a-2 TaxID=196490 RepID=UPI0005B93195|nr:cysteine rich repeat-containing protein [Bradyrhizobium sp. Ai1a-2]
MLRKIILMIGAILTLWTSSATAQKGLEVGHCVADLKKLCPGVEPGEGRLLACMREHIHDVSLPCLVTLSKFAEVHEADNDCSEHIKQRCASVDGKGGEFGACLKSAVASLSDTCKDELARAVHGARTQ